jgi:hypothetical protein
MPATSLARSPTHHSVSLGAGGRGCTGLSEYERCRTGVLLRTQRFAPSGPEPDWLYRLREFELQVARRAKLPEEMLATRRAQRVIHDGESLDAYHRLRDASVALVRGVTAGRSQADAKTRRLADYDGRGVVVTGGERRQSPGPALPAQEWLPSFRGARALRRIWCRARRCR